MHFGSPSDPCQTAAAEVNPRYVYSILKSHGQSSRRPVRLLSGEAKPSYVHSILKPHGQSLIASPESVQSSCVLRGYILGVLTHTTALDRLWGGDETEVF